MTIKALIDLFLSGARDGSNGTKTMPGNLKIHGNYLIHYNTVIAERLPYGKYIVNLSQYSIQTGSVQKQLKQALQDQKYTIVKKVPRDYSGSLIPFIKKLDSSLGES